MNSEQVIDAIGCIDDTYIESAQVYRASKIKECKLFTLNQLVRYVSVAACLSIGLGFLISSIMKFTGDRAVWIGSVLPSEIAEFYEQFEPDDPNEDGWHVEGDKVFYIRKGNYVTGFFSGAEGFSDTFYFEPEDLSMHTGWLTLGDKTYYFDEYGKMLKGTYAEIDGETYFFDEDGVKTEYSLQ